jgi:Patatin-like phospholipase
MKLSEAVFDTDQLLAGEIPVGDDQCRFDFNVLENKLKELIMDRLGDEDWPMFEGIAPSGGCHTFVVARYAQNVGAPPVLFRSYSVEGDTRTKCAIWQAIRATTAMPTFLKPIYIDRPPIAYVDGGVGSNNPSQLALIEAQRLWGRDAKVCLVSIGAGHGPAVSIVDVDEGQMNTDLEAQRSVFELVVSSLSAAALKIPMWSTATSIPPGAAALLKMAKALRSMAMDTESTHELVGRAADMKFPYFRFNPERGVGDIGVHDWKKFHGLATHTNAYMLTYDTSKKKTNCSKCLIDPNDFYSTIPYLYQLTDTFRTFRVGVLFPCSLPAKSKICWSN